MLFRRDNRLVNLVGAFENRRGDRQANHLSGFQVDGDLFGGIEDLPHLPRRCAVQDPPDDLGLVLRTEGGRL